MDFYDDRIKENINENYKTKRFYTKSRFGLVKFFLVPFIIIVLFLISINVFMYVNHFDKIIEVSDEFGVDPALVASIIHSESKFDAYALSPKDAYGLMQITYETFQFVENNTDLDEQTFKDITKKDLNIYVGTWYYSYLLDRFDGIQVNALCAYNAGPNTVDSWLENPDYSPDGENLYKIPYEETNNYVHKINTVYPIYKSMINLKF